MMAMCETANQIRALTEYMRYNGINRNESDKSIATTICEYADDEHTITDSHTHHYGDE